MAEKTTVPFSLELKKFSHAEFASRDSACFEADIWINGKPVFHARNEGRGGSDHYTPLAYDDAGHKAMAGGVAALQAHIATLPPYETYRGAPLPWSAELFIATAV